MPHFIHLHKKNPAHIVRDFFGAGSRGRTDTVSLPQDFESSASANSTIPAYCGRICNHERYYNTISKKNQEIFQKN